MENDPAREWQRMQEVYSQMTEEELQNAAEEAYELTDIAKQALEAEIRTRRLGIKLVAERPEEVKEEPVADVEEGEFDPEQYELESIYTAWEEKDARTAKWVLDNAGLPSYFGPDNEESIDEYKGSYARGVDLKVPSHLAELAMAAMAAHWPVDPNKPPEPEFRPAEVRCPKCHSDEVVFDSVEEAPDKSVVDSKYNWHCDACGHQWQDDGVEREA